MAIWTCGECTAAYPPGHAKCPQCGADNPLERPTPRRKKAAKAATPAPSGEAVNEGDAASS